MLRWFRSVWGSGRWALYVPAALWGWLSIELLAGRFLDWGVARKRREHIKLKSGVPTSVHHDQEGIVMTMIGIDPHKATHTAVAIDDNEVVLDEFKLRASPTQAQRLRQWAAGFEKRQWAVESANGLGYLVAQQLVAAGETVFDVSCLGSGDIAAL